MRQESVRSRTEIEMQKEAKRLKNEFQDYLEDLELFSKQSFWNALRESEHLETHKNFKAFKKKMGV